MKTLIKLLVAALIVHGSWRAGMVYWRYYKFKDGVQSLALFSGMASESQLQNRVLEIAGDLGVPLAPERVSVRHEENHTIIDATYRENIEILPTYFYPWDFKVNVDAFSVAP